MLRSILLLFVISLCLSFSSFSQVPTAEIQRQQELLEKERELRKRIDKEPRIFIKKIILKGVSLLSEEEYKKIILPFQKRWLTKEDIQQILEKLSEVYKQKKSIPEIVYQIKRNQLLILIKE
ncbi:MAG: hypothetical protein N2Z79_00765 [Candidatus Omnitrophica bacterium]|nr:hypothetical protein [Candidatus Omnitrophota bacterium]